MKQKYCHRILGDKNERQNIEDTDNPMERQIIMDNILTKHLETERLRANQNQIEDFQ